MYLISNLSFLFVYSDIVPAVIYYFSNVYITVTSRCTLIQYVTVSWYEVKTSRNFQSTLIIHVRFVISASHNWDSYPPGFHGVIAGCTSLRNQEVCPVNHRSTTFIQGIQGAHTRNFCCPTWAEFILTAKHYYLKLDTNICKIINCNSAPNFTFRVFYLTARYLFVERY